MGTMEPRMTLVDSVAHNARAAALKDPRAPRIDIDEVDDLSVEVSLLSPLERLSFTDEASLLAQLRPGVDGLLLSWRGHHGTFLPQVWESLPEPRLFLSQLKRKAWLPVDFWAPDVTIERYTVQKWIDPAPLRRRAAG